jgi:hypothetical protein
MNQMISDFVHDALLRGVSREDIAQALRRGGWALKEINEALDAYVESDLPRCPANGFQLAEKPSFFLRYSPPLHSGFCA